MTELPSRSPDDQLLSADIEPKDPSGTDFNRQILLVTSLPPPESVARATAIRNQASFSLSKLLWLVTMVAVMLGVYNLVPRLAENINYGLTRGRQRAEYENARERLKDLPLEGLSAAYQLVSQKVGPSVVHINVETKSPGDVAEEAANRFHRFRDFSGQGSGVIVDAEGYIVTNLHVVRAAEKIQVSLSDGRRVPGKLIGTDDETDIALIKVDAGQLLPADWGDSEQLNVGALVWAVGSPFGLERSVTAGILSAKHRAAWPARRIRTSCKPMRRSIPATAADRWSMHRARWSASTRRLSASRTKASASPCPAALLTGSMIVSAIKDAWPAAGWESNWRKCRRRHRPASSCRQVAAHTLPAWSIS